MPDKGRGYMRRKTTKTRKRKASSNVNNSQLTRMIKNVSIKEAETKYKTLNYTWGALSHDDVFHKDLWSSTINLFPGQGTSDSNRIGDRIVCQGIMLRAVFDVPWDRKNVRLKAYFIPYNSDQGAVDTYNNVFHNITGNARLDPVQKKRYPGIRYLGTYTIEPERAPYYTYSGGDQTPAASVISSNTGTICIKKWLPMYNKKLFFRSDATNQPANLTEKGAIVLAPYATINTTTLDNIILSGEMSATVYYKDL